MGKRVIFELNKINKMFREKWKVAINNHMNIHFIVLIFVATIFIRCTNNTINCEIKTTEGSIFVELYPEKAPITVANFLKYIESTKYDNSSFFRVCDSQNEADRKIKIEVIQGGLLDETSDFPPIQLETTVQTGIQHKNGTISMARLEPHTATNSFFICIGDQPDLDFGGERNPDGQGFGAFGKVTKGMDIVLTIQKQKDTSQYLVKPILIESIRRIE